MIDALQRFQILFKIVNELMFLDIDTYDVLVLTVCRALRLHPCWP